MEIIAISFNEKTINIELPIKVAYKIIEAPPAIKETPLKEAIKSSP